MPLDLYISDGRIMLFTATTPTGYSFKEGGLPGGYSCIALARDHVESAKLYCCLSDGDVYYTSDGGDNWTKIGDNVTDFENNLATTVFANTTIAGEVWVGAAAQWKSTDYGSTWSKKSDWGYSVAHMSAHGLTIWVTHQDMFGISDVNVSLNGANFVRKVNNIFQNARHSHCSGAPSKGMAWSTSENYGPVVTLDGWDSYADKSSGMAATGEGHYSPGGDYILAHCAGHLYKSTDDGDTWTEKLTHANVPDKTTNRYGAWWDLASGRVYVAGTSGYIFYSDDDGETWSNWQIDRGISAKALMAGIAATGTASLAFKLVIA